MVRCLHTTPSHPISYVALGTADSTIPSPAPEHRRPAMPLHVYSNEATDDDLGVLTGAPVLSSALRPSQHAIDLSDRLHALEERMRSFPNSEGDAEDEDLVPELSKSWPSTNPGSPEDITTEDGPRIRENTESRPVDSALRDAIRGVYGLWRQGAGREAGVEEFMIAVRDAVYGV